ncbi:hypothetical protein M501DRAFT_901271, partial [Patellaria atrata CBS 101060]
EPETENEFLEAADELEKAGGKWRAGDPVKAMRFFQKAIEIYDAGLQKWGVSFDLAYNKALLQYQITQDHRISHQLGNPQELLQETLRAHRFALSLDQNNADILFNTGQVLTSLAEAITEKRSNENAKVNAIRLLQEAGELFSACLAHQELDFSEYQAQTDAMNAHELSREARDVPDAKSTEQVSTNEDMDTSSETSAPVEWATVLEPVSASTLLETVIAALSALTTLVSLMMPAHDNSLATLFEIATPLIKQKIPYYISLLSSEAEQETSLAIATFMSTMAEAEFRSGFTDIPTYQSSIAEAFESLTTNSSPSSSTPPKTDVLCAHADALIAFAAAVADVSDPTPDAQGQSAVVRWKALSKSQELLTAAAKAQDKGSTDMVTLYLTRGDVEVLRWRIASSPTASEGYRKHGDVLIKNAGVWYRG